MKAFTSFGRGLSLRPNIACKEKLLAKCEGLFHFDKLYVGQGCPSPTYGLAGHAGRAELADGCFSFLDVLLYELYHSYHTKGQSEIVILVELVVLVLLVVVFIFSHFFSYG